MFEVLFWFGLFFCFSLARTCLSPQKPFLCSGERHVLSGHILVFIPTFLCLQTYLIFTGRAEVGFCP